MGTTGFRADKQWGEVPVAVIVGSASIDDIRNACLSLAKYKQPRDTIFVESLPKNALGKIKTQEVKAMISR